MEMIYNNKADYLNPLTSNHYCALGIRVVGVKKQVWIVKVLIEMNQMIF